MPQLVVLTGLPCSGKSTLAEGLARAMAWPVFSVDPIDSAMRGDGVDPDTAGQAAYSVAAALAAEQLALGLSVIVDACNAHGDARAMWTALAARWSARFSLIEVACRDEAVHKARVASRVRALPHYPEVVWADVEAARAAYRPWDVQRLELDSSAERPAALLEAALAYLAR